MGNMVPFTQFEYVQYTNRSVYAESLKRNGIPVSKRVQPIQFLRKSEPAFDMENKEGHESRKGNRISVHAVDRIISDITGLGKYINLTV